MDMGLFSYVLILVGGYAGLRLLAWDQSAIKSKKAYWARDLLQIDSMPVKSACWTRTFNYSRH